MKCINCGNEVDDNSAVCPYCYKILKLKNENKVEETKEDNVVTMSPIEIETTDTVKSSNIDIIPDSNIGEKNDVVSDFFNDTSTDNITVEHKNLVTKVENDLSLIETTLSDYPILDNKEKKEEIKKENYIVYKVIILIGVLIIIALLVFIFKDFSKKKEPLKETTTKATTTKQIFTHYDTKNVGRPSTISYPFMVGETTLASIYDPYENKYTNVDVKLNRFLKEEEVEKLVKENNYKKNHEDFIFEGLEYTVKLNDLDYLKNPLDPKLKVSLYRYDGKHYVTYMGKNIEITLSSISDKDKILNNQSANVKVIYSIPLNLKEYSICFGYFSQSIGCFSKG